MRKVVFGINVSIDGYCGHESGVAADDELHQYFTDLLRQSDVHLLGRNTYELMYPFWHDVAVAQSEGPALNEFASEFDSIAKLVFSTTMERAEWNNTTLLRSGLREKIVELKQQPGKDIAIGSINLAAQAEEWGLIDEYHFVVHPVIAGKGPRLFKPGGGRSLTLLNSRVFGSGAVALHYKK
jgi:dihydrofolate reductase